MFPHSMVILTFAPGDSTHRDQDGLEGSWVDQQASCANGLPAGYSMLVHYVVDGICQSLPPSICSSLNDSRGSDFQCIWIM